MTTSALEDPPESFAPARHQPVTPGPFTGILGFGRDAERTGQTAGMVLATALHALVAVMSLASLLELRDFATLVQVAARARFDATIDIAVDEPEPEVEPEPPPPPEPEVAPPASELPLPEEAPAPAAAEAAEVLTAAPSPDEPLDLTADTMISGTSTRFAGGLTAADGTAQKAVRTATATAQGAVGGQGTAPAPPPPPAKDQSQPAGLIPGEDWNDCPFPAEADAEQQNHAMVRLVIVVGADGRPSSVSVVSDPGYGFGQAARKCALRKRYTPGRDSAGKPVAKATPPFGVRFKR